MVVKRPQNVKKYTMHYFWYPMIEESEKNSFHPFLMMSAKLRH